MDDEQFEYPYPLLIIAGKGGVGKTVLTATLGTAAVGRDHSTLVVEIGGQAELPKLLRDADRGEATKPDDEGIHALDANLAWVSLSPERLLAGWLSGRNMGLIADRLERSGALSVIASSVPGIKDVLVLGRLRALIESGRWDRVIVDGPASGRARELLRAPRLLADVTDEGPIASQANRAHSLLTDCSKTGVLFVTLAEETPISETIETAFDLEDDPGVHLAGVVVNRVFPMMEPPRSLAGHRSEPAIRARWDQVDAATRRLAEDLPIAQLMIREVAAGVTGPESLKELRARDPGALSAGIAPEFASSAGGRDALDRLLDRQVIVTVGSGGVGKTSIAAALSMRAAERGNRVALVTIDPARRLADALGLSELDDSVRTVAAPKGSFDATMLDARATFDRVVTAHADDADQAERILDSPLTRRLVDGLSGVTEYMAVERLWELTTDEGYELVIVDTPPSADAIAFLEAPTLLARLLDNRMYRLLVHDGRASVLRRAMGGILNRLVETVGGAVVGDAVAFFRSFAGMESGFRERGQAIHELLRSDETAFVVVASPSADSLDHASRFTEQLREMGVEPVLTIANRCTPDPGESVGEPAADALLDHLRVRRAAEQGSLAGISAVHDVPMVSVPELAGGVARLEDVASLAERL